MWGRELPYLAYWLDRTENAVAERAKKLELRRPTMTLRAFARFAGVTTARVYWALEMRGIALERVHRASLRRAKERGSHYAITPAQQDELLSLLRAHPRENSGRGRGRREYTMDRGPGKSMRGVWGCGRKPDCCRECETTERPHFAKGLCKPCYIRAWKWLDSRKKNPKRQPRTPPPRVLFVRE